MSGSRRSKGFKPNEIAALSGVVIFFVVVVVMIAALAWPKIEENWFPEPTPVPGVSRTYPVKPTGACDEPDTKKPMPIIDPQVEGYVVSALVDMEESGALRATPESLEGWVSYWVYDMPQGRLEYWTYGAGDSAGLVFELLPRCFWPDPEGMLWAEFSEVTVRELQIAGEGNRSQ